MSPKQDNHELEADKKRRIIHDYLYKVMELNPDLYYSSTAEVAREVHLMIKEHKNRMPVEEQALFRKLTVRDVEVILSFH
ncbi:hypothetical protein VH441_01320 [Psychrobacter sp. HD31]|uniref:hypothetical protein n=1 Tax=Psychrobacter sp. HD31 TaxID=3112003 RepID=UPI003DA6C36D